MSRPGVPPKKLPSFGQHPLAKGTLVHRFCSVARGANVFNPCIGKRSRFAPLYAGGTPPGCVPTLYVGETYEAAAFESIFRDIPPLPGLRVVREASLANVGHATLEVMRDLILAPFFHQNLGILGQSRQSMIDTDATAYDETVLWAAAVHDNFPHLDGLVWTSRQHDRDFACVLFGDRVQEADMKPISATQAIDAGPGRAKIGAFAKDYKIDILRP